jgi:hypothetical protein
MVYEQFGKSEVAQIDETTEPLAHRIAFLEGVRLKAYDTLDGSVYRSWVREALRVSAGLSLIFFGLLPVSAGGVPPELPGVEVVERRLGNSFTFALRNPQLAELTVSLDFKALNLESNVRVPLEMVVPPKCTTEPLVVLRPIDPSKARQYAWHCNFTWGSPRAHHANDQLYLLPFAPGNSFRVVQGHNGGFSHTGEDRFAIDFDMPEGSQILAARGGLAALVRDGFDAGAPDPNYKSRANLVFVRHSDGTIGEYVHLLKGGIRVKEGETVRAGQMIALSGNSGYSRGPHLHFMVFRAKDSKTRESLPIEFITEEGSGVVLKEGRTYRAPILIKN